MQLQEVFEMYEMYHFIGQRTHKTSKNVYVMTLISRKRRLVSSF